MPDHCWQDRIELKLDQVNDVVTELARMEERQTVILENQSRFTDRLDKQDAKIETMIEATHDMAYTVKTNALVSSRVSKMFWVIISGLVTAVITYIWTVQ